MKRKFDIGIIYEHPQWHEPLFEALNRKNISYAKFDLKRGAFNGQAIAEADLYYNLVSPSAYLRGNQRAIPYAIALCRQLEMEGCTVLNGSKSIQIEMSKSSQIAMLKKLAIDHPQTVVFNSVEALKNMNGALRFPMILKPEQGGSGARMFLVNDLTELEILLQQRPELWLPDNLLLLQEKLDYDPAHGIIRLEFVGGELLYAMRVVTNGKFNLCPSVVCNPEDGNGHCDVQIETVSKPEFYPYHDVEPKAIHAGKKIMLACGHSTGSVEYLITKNGRMVFYDINSNSNLRESIASEFGKQAFDEVANFLKGEIASA
jgi:carbamoylphosphate synthase large subunit